MELDIYAPCPCGSGKKLKFCCAPIIGEMTKVARLQAGDQPRQAMQLLEKLEKSHPNNPLVVCKHADLLVGLGQYHEAKELLESLLKVQPDYPTALATLALASFLADGYEPARSAIQRAFQKCITRCPSNVGVLALAVASTMEPAGHDMAARQYLSLAVRLLEEKPRETAFMMLLQVDGNAAIPYPLRSVHNLTPYPRDGKNATEAERAGVLANIGCWGPAARAFARIAESEPQNAALWRNLGLCRAWDADEAGAAQAFHRAASTSEDYEFAVECETLAQWCDLKRVDDSLRPVDAHYAIGSASRLLGLLEGNDRISPASQDEDEDDEEAPLAGSFVFRDKPLPTETDAGLSLDQIPVVAAALSVRDRVPESGKEAEAVLRGYDDETFDAARKLFESLAESEISGPAEVELDETKERIPRAHFPFLRVWQFPPDLHLSVQRALSEAQWRHLVDEVWLNAPHSALEGQSPLAAKGKPQYRVRLAAAAYVLDSLAQTVERSLDLASLFGRLELEPLRPLEPDPELAISALSPMQLHRLPVSRLSDSQVLHAHRRAVLIGHRRFVNDVLQETVARPKVLAQLEADQVYRSLVTLAQKEGRYADALRWIQEAKENTAKGADSFAQTLTWTMAEFGVRAELPDDPELPNLYRHLSEFYAPKVPQLAAVLEGFRRQFGNQFPWLQSSELLVESGAVGGPTAGGIWIPGAAADSSSAGSGKLWLPGQE